MFMGTNLFILDENKNPKSVYTSFNKNTSIYPYKVDFFVIKNQSIHNY